MPNVFEAAKSVSLTEVLKHFGHMTMTRKLNTLTCPICGHNGCFSIFDRRQKFHCFSCKAIGDNIQFVTLMNKVTAVEAATMICDEFNVEYTQPQPQYQPDPDKARYISVNTYLATLCQDKYTKSKYNYFAKRGLNSYQDGGYCDIHNYKGKYIALNLILKKKFPGLTDQELFDWGICDANGNGIMTGRYTIPIRDKNGDIIAFGGRSVKENTEKYINTKNNKFFSKRYVLFNYHVAKKYSSIYVVEGYMDALSLIEAGVPNVVATLGTALSDEQYTMLANKDIILAYDSDIAGQSNIAEVILKHKDKQFKVFKLKGYKDLNDALVAGEDIAKLVKDVEEAPLWFLGYLLDKYDWSKNVERSDAWKEFASFLGSNRVNWIKQYPLNTTYTPVDLDFYWKKFTRCYRKKLTKNNSERKEENKNEQQ